MYLYIGEVMDDKIKSNKEKLANAYKYAFECWMKNFQSVPIEEVEHYSVSVGYDVHDGHIFKLEDGNYAVVIEDGCSCYDYDEAEIEIFKEFDKALDSYNKSKKRADSY